MHTYKVGDKVRIVDVNAILFGDESFDNGNITEVTMTDSRGIYLRSIKNTDRLGSEESLIVLNEELEGVELVREGEEAAAKLAAQQQAEIDELRSDVKELVDMIVDLEVELSEVKAEVRKGEEKIYLDPERIATELFRSPTENRPNEGRRLAIERAKDFIKEITSITTDGFYTERELKGFSHPIYVTKTEFVVNEEKRTVVALARGLRRGGVILRGIAKCDPSDVFNADIGKAIALGRAYGLDVEEFEHAPQPDEIVPGMVINSLYYGNNNISVPGRIVSRVNDNGYPVFDDGRFASHYEIISDSKADYEGGSY
jgi:hypothetical protein